MSKDDTAVKDEVAEATVEAPAAPAPKDPEQDLEEIEVELSDDEEETEDKPEKEVDETKPEEKLSPKSENRFQKLANDNRELKEQIERLKSQEAQIATEQDLLNEVNPETGEPYTPQEVERIAFTQSRENRQQSIAEQRYEMEVLSNQQTLQGEANRALQEFPMFDPDSDQFNPELSAQVDQVLGKSLIFEEGTNRVIGSHTSPYELYKTINDAAQSSIVEGQIKGQKAHEKMLANADTTGNASNATKPKVDPLLDGFDEEAKR